MVNERDRVIFFLFLPDEGHLYMFGSDYYGCLGCDQNLGDEVSQPTIVEYFVKNFVKQVACGDCHVVVLAGNAKPRSVFSTIL